ncbi:Protein of unknown function [Pseudoxanthomonas sp. GM95]|uniref:DUF1203 domain-containing protein n=1 Tax=Pseudoxanthomonas sp. GM95 TaxID=1881043 RepID=UPI0008C29973|nr:DUF1203 domain-containing protein [Pseudoxanthomonas sp. GM95]SEK48626.1 Protein of unknown function [Pseudoxanthomonas sp. GM95]
MSASTFQLCGLDPAPFQPLFALNDASLAARGALRRIVDNAPGYPCRISLEDAALGETVLLLPYLHQATDSPYRSSGPIYVRANAKQATLAPGHVPTSVSSRLISLRAYDEHDMMVCADVHPGNEVAAALEVLFADAGVAYVHLHNARQGCFSCLARRVDS